jgi:hypothetical protein
VPRPLAPHVVAEERLAEAAQGGRLPDADEAAVDLN